MYAVLPAYITTVLINYGKNNNTEIKATYHEYSHTFFLNLEVNIINVIFKLNYKLIWTCHEVI